MFVVKTLDQLMTQSMKRLNGTPITEIGPGGVARLLLAVMNENVAEFYETFGLNHAQAYISQATGNNIDLVGYALNCPRVTGEEDDAYKYRVCNQVLSIAAANETAIRLAALSVEGVKDVILKPYTFGTGSFSIFVVTDNPYTDQSVIDAVETKVDSVKGYGIRFAVFIPNTIAVELKAMLIFNKGTDDATKKLVAAQVKQVIRDYVNSRMPGESIVINVLNELIIQASTTIYDYQITSFAINGRPVLPANQDSKWNERFIESSKPSAIDVR